MFAMFSPDAKIMQELSRLTDLVLLNSKRLPGLFLSSSIS